jgi:hypothetical protein
MKIYITNPETNELIPIQACSISFFSDTDQLLLNEDILEVIDAELLAQLEDAENV